MNGVIIEVDCILEIQAIVPFSFPAHMRRGY